MSATYWKLVGENIAKGLGEKTIRRFGIGGKFIGRAGAVVGIGFLAYELFKHYKENIEAEPAYQEMRILQAELEKWSSAVSSLGREAFEEKAYGSQSRHRIDWRSPGPGCGKGIDGSDHAGRHRHPR